MTSHTILVVDDDADIREALSDLLELEGFHVMCAANGQEALEHLATSGPPCLIVLDLMMPVMDGWHFLSEKRSRPSLVDIPVVVVSAATPDQTRALPVQHVLRKPLRIEDVLDHVQRHC